MDITDNNSNKHCYKCDQQVLGSLNIVCNTSNSMTVLWNKHQILVYEQLRFQSAARILEPEFQIFSLLLFKNHIACLDCSGNVHVISLKFKNSTQKRLKSCFQPRKQNILGFAQNNIDALWTLQWSNDNLFLSLHQISKEFQLDKEFLLLFDEEHSVSIRREQKCIVKCFPISESNLKYVKELFNVQESVIHNSIIIMSFDNLTVYTCLISPKMAEDEIKMIKFYSCPSEICSIEINENDDLKIVIGLKVGSVIVIPLKDTERTPVIVHLNTAIYKFIVFKNIMIHTDGCTMWKTENLYSKDINLNQLFVKQVNDFIKIHNNIICTTFSNLIYIFSNDETAYIKVHSTEEYSSADKLLNNTECLNKIMNEIKKNEELVKKLSKEENYITALSLSNRQDIMNDVIKIKIIVYESYEDATKEYVPITLTEDIEEYFKPETTFILINIFINIIHSIFNNILTNLFTDMKIHLTFSTESKLLMTTSIKLGEQLQNINYLIPLRTTSTKIYVNMVFITNIPGAYDEKQTGWTVLYRKHVLLNSEHFIKTNITDKIQCLKKSVSPEELLLKINQNHYGHLFKFTDISKSATQENQWSLYVKLSNNYPEILKNSDYCEKYLNFKTADVLSRQYKSEEFLKSKNKFVLMVGDEKIKLEVINDGFSNPVLRISGENLKTTSDIRNFFANIIYSEFNSNIPDEEFISHTFYATVENIQKAVRMCIMKSFEMDELISLGERFERNVIGALPM